MSRVNSVSPRQKTARFCSTLLLPIVLLCSLLYLLVMTPQPVSGAEHETAHFSIEAEGFWNKLSAKMASTSRSDYYVIDNYENDMLSYSGTLDLDGDLPSNFRVNYSSKPTNISFSSSGSGSCFFESTYVIRCRNVSSFNSSAYWQIEKKAEDGKIKVQVGGTSWRTDFRIKVAYLSEFEFLNATPPPNNHNNNILEWIRPNSTALQPNMEFAIDGEPESKVEATHPLNSRFLKDEPLENTIKAFVDWGGEPAGGVDFVINGKIIAGTPNGDNTVYELVMDMGKALKLGDNTIAVSVYDHLDQPVDLFIFDPCQAAVPLWLSGMIAADAADPIRLSRGISVDTKYESAFQFPLGNFDMNVPLIGPLIGNANGFKFQAGGSLEIPFDQEKPMKLNMETAVENKVKFLGVQLKGSVGLKSSLNSTPHTCDIDPFSGEFGATFELKGKKEWPVLEFVVNYFVPGAGEHFTGLLEKLGVDPSFFGGEFYVSGKLGAELTTQLSPHDAFPYINWHDPTLEFGPSIEGGYNWDLYVIELKLFIGAGGKGIWEISGVIRDVSDIKPDRVKIVGRAGYETRAFFWSDKTTYELEWIYPAPLNRNSYRPVHHTGFQLIRHDRAVDYSRFENATSHNYSRNSIDQSVLVSNVYRYAEPHLGLNANDDTALLLWVYDDLSKPIGQAHEIQYSYWNGSSWSSPSTITDDAFMDGHPQVSWAADGNGVAVWHRLTEALDPEAELEPSTVDKMEIATAVYSPTISSWLTPTLLTNNTKLDHTPQIVRSPTGQLMAIWRQNNGAKLIGDADNPDQLWYAIYDSGWSTPTLAVNNLTNVYDIVHYFRGNSAVVVYVQAHLDKGTTQLFMTEWDGIRWTVPREITNSHVRHTNPRLAPNKDGQLMLVWMTEADLRIRNLATEEMVVFEFEEMVNGINKFELLNTSEGDIVGLFTNQDEQRDLMLFYYDESIDSWGYANHLTQDTANENYFSAAIDSNDQLVMSYVSTAVEYEEASFTLDSGEVITYLVPIETQSDLLTLSKAFATNLTFEENSLELTNTHPEPGEKVEITAVIKNNGDFLVNDVDVSFYQGTTDTSGVLLGTQTLDTLASGFTSTVTLSFTPPAAGGPTQLYAVVDPNKRIVESNESDNVVFLTAFGPDIKIDAVEVQNLSGSSVRLVSQLTNLGTSPTPPTTLNFYRETDLLAATTIIPPIQPGESIVHATPWSFGELARGEHLLTAVVNQDQTDFEELHLHNNQTNFSIQVVSDLAVDEDAIQTMLLPDQNTKIFATISNVSLTHSPAAKVSLYLDVPNREATLLKSWTIDELAPLSDITLDTTHYIDGTHTLYVVIDPHGEIDEMTRLNNIALRTITVEPAKFIYLPVVVND